MDCYLYIQEYMPRWPSGHDAGHLPLFFRVQPSRLISHNLEHKILFFLSLFKPGLHLHTGRVACNVTGKSIGDDSQRHGGRAGKKC